MASSLARSIFIISLCINVLIWSRGRYAQPAALHFEGGHSLGSSLVKRTIYELTQPREMVSYEEGKEQCQPLSIPLALQCRHVNEACAKSDTFLGINYLLHYYCSTLPLRPFVFAGLVFWLLFLFSTLGISASDFFTPNLASIAHLLGLDENVAGVTFLAFGNGSPDVFSTFSAMRANSGGLAIGELVGAASFIVSCVVGSMCIIKPFHVHPRPFLRDVGFFTAAVSLLLVILWDGVIHPWEAGLLIFLYLVYVLVVVVGAWWGKRRDRKRAREALIRSEYQDDGILFEPYTDHPRSSDTLTVHAPIPTRGRAVSVPAPPRLQTNLQVRRYYSRSPSPNSSPQLPSFSLIGALEFRDVVQSLQREASTSSLGIFESPVTPYAGGHYHSHSQASPFRRQRRASQASRDEDTLNELALDDRTRAASPASQETVQDDPNRLHPGESSEYFPAHTLQASVPSILRTPASPTSSPTISDQNEVLYIPPTRKQRVFNTTWQVFHTLFPTLHCLGQQTVLGAVASIVAAPAVFLLTLTLPVVAHHHDGQAEFEKPQSMPSEAPLIEFEEEGLERILIAEEEVLEDMHPLEYNKWLMAAQCVCGPLFCVEVLFGSSDHELALVLATLLGGVAVGSLVLMVGGSGNSPSGKMMRCSMGFLVAIVWIMAIADEVVNVLQAFGTIFGLSDAIIGLTIFAMGNSLADLVANMTVAVFAPIMGFSACFGGPMLNILLGVGISSTYIMRGSGEPYALELSTTLLVSSMGLLTLLAATLVFVPFNKFYLSRRWGFLLILSYIAIMTTNVIVELRS